MPLTKTQLIGKIYKAFESVTLDDGIGLWEGWALGERLKNTRDYERLKAKDERNDWQKIAVSTIYECSSSLSFFDAKGIRFHLPLYLLFALDIFTDDQDNLYHDKNVNRSPPEVNFTLTYRLNSEYTRNRFALLSTAQIECVVCFLEYNFSKSKQGYLRANAKQRSRFEILYSELQEAISLWKIKALVQ